MAEDGGYLGLLRNKVQQIVERSPGMESMPGVESVAPDPAAIGFAPAESGSLEAVIRWYRPVLAVAGDRFVRQSDDSGGDQRFIDPNQAASKALMDVLELHRSVLDPAIRSVGRIELINNVRHPWVGTGWIIGSDLGADVIVTNAHVGREFGMRSGEGYVFRPGIPNTAVRQSARIDFREEVEPSSPREFPIRDIIWISELPGLDVCLLRVARMAGNDRIDPPIQLLTSTPADNSMVAVIGFPGSNNGYDPTPFLKLFGSVTGNKRFSPGFYSGRRGGSVTYDCSTLPGSSGSAVLDVQTGKAIGLHYAGTAFDTNFGVSAVDLSRIIAQRPWIPKATNPRQPPPLLGDGLGSSTSGAVGPPLTVSAASSLTTGGAGSSPPPGASQPLAGGAMTFVVPLEITIKLGGMMTTTATTSPVQPAATPSTRADRESAEAAAEKVRQHLLGDSSVLAVKADYLFRDGVITDEFGVIVAVAPGETIDPAARGLGARIDGVAISVETADPATMAEQMFAVHTEAFAGRFANYKRDLSDPRFDLSPVTDDMTIMLHVSPEAGWPVLKEFLSDKKYDQLTIGMYHMTAPHVVQALTSIAGRRNSAITLTLDRQRGDAKNPDDTGPGHKADDIPEGETLDALEDIAGKRFKWAPASLGASGLFASAYHIKVAVWGDRGQGKEASRFWLSSGNWQSSNQAPLKRTIPEIGKVTQDEVEGYNREWHALVDHSGLATTLRNHLEQDYKDNHDAAQVEAPMPAMFDVLVPIGMREEAPRARDFQVFEPKIISGKVKIQPLLTPDNYPEIISQLILKAKHRVLIENQSFNFWKNPDSMPKHFLNIANAVRDQQREGLDVRIIFRSGFGKERETLRQMKAFGLKTDADHVRYFDRCHTKGFVIDDDIAILGSQNITAAGVGPNRDASLVIWHKDANAYFASLFEYDWRQIGRTRARSHEGVASVRLVRADDESPAPGGYRRISIAEFLGET